MRPHALPPVIGLYLELNTFVIVVITNVFVFGIPITFVNTFGSRLRHARALRQLTQQELADACGLSQGAIGNYETDSRRSPKDVFRMAEILHIEPAWLAMGTGPMEPAPQREVADVPASAIAWPFPGVDPERVWALHPRQRRKLAEALLSMLAALDE